MKHVRFVQLTEQPEWIEASAKWFHTKWGVPEQAYLDSMHESLKSDAVIPKWFIVLEKEQIIAGAGVIENDFHDHEEWTPNLCALYVEEDYRKQGLAGEILAFVCNKMKEQGLKELYLVTDHCSFYEKYGWIFVGMVQGDGEIEKSRMYQYILT